MRFLASACSLVLALPVAAQEPRLPGEVELLTPARELTTSGAEHARLAGARAQEMVVATEPATLLAARGLEAKAIVITHRRRR